MGGVKGLNLGKGKQGGVSLFTRALQFESRCTMRHNSLVIPYRVCVFFSYVIFCGFVVCGCAYREMFIFMLIKNYIRVYYACA